MKTFSSRALFGATAAATAGFAYLLASCAYSNVTTLYTPYTGLRLSSAQMFAGHTCGVGPGQIYEYVAVVSAAGPDGDRAPVQPSPLPLAMVYACGVNGAFQNLPGAGSYRIAVYAYDKASFPPELECGPDAPACGPPPTDGGALGTPTWMTTCNGTQESGDNSLVSCEPLQPYVTGAGAGSGGIDASVDARGDGGSESTDGGSAEGSAVSPDGANSDGNGGTDGAISDATNEAADGAGGETDALDSAVSEGSTSTDAAVDGSPADADAGPTDAGAADGADGT